MNKLWTAFLAVVWLVCVALGILLNSEGASFSDQPGENDAFNPPLVEVHQSIDDRVFSNSNTSLCFLASVYGQWATHADKLQNVERLPFYNSTLVHFLAFTNMPNVKAPGWQKIVRRYPQYTRYITQSRVPKFLGWQDPVVKENCEVVFYMDSIGHIIGNLTDFQRAADEILASRQGHSQYLHRGGGGAFGEFRRIEVFEKDSLDNIRASKKWLSAQPDFDPNCTLYENRYIGYAINSTSFHEAAEFLWARYSQELDSWRDQPLWW